MQESKTLLFTDEKAEKALNNRVKTINKLVKSLKKLHKDTTGAKSVSVSELIKDGSQGFLKAFIVNYGNMFPPIANMQLMFQQTTGIKTSEIDHRTRTLKTLIEKEGDNVNIGTNEVKANVYEETFKRYLNEEKRGDYEMALELLESANKVKDLNPYAGMLHVQRFAPANWYTLSGTRLKLNLNNFASKW